MTSHATEISAGARFEFGANWSRFLTVLDDSRVSAAEESLKQMLRVDTLSGKRFLDAGSGSGLFSLAARRLGAQVRSFDYDPQSVACTRELKRRYFPDDDSWIVEEASVLDTGYLRGIGRFDIVYSWGVLHHTGSMWRALENIAESVAAGGALFIALYNDQGWLSKYWSAVKRQYNQRPSVRPLLTVVHAPYLLGARLIARALTGRLREQRGMSLWYDMFDWLGGWPFEVSRPGEVVEFLRARDFTQRTVKTVGRREGCNEFVLFRQP